jgi:hypothetical protein
LRFDGGQENLYVFVNNNPVNRTDPSGLAENSRTAYSACVSRCFQEWQDSAAAECLDPQGTLGDVVDSCQGIAGSLMSGGSGSPIGIVVGEGLESVCGAAPTIAASLYLAAGGICYAQCLSSGNPLEPPCPDYLTDEQCHKSGFGGF